MAVSKSDRPHPFFNGLFAGASRDQVRCALADLETGFRRYQLWAVLGFYEIKQRYRRSRIGPLWITLSMGIFIGALGILYGAILGQPLGDYMPYLAAGFLTWSFLSAAITDGSEVFLRSGGVITQLNAPLSTYVYRLVCVNVIIFLHNMLIFVVVVVWFAVDFTPASLFFIPGLVLLSFNAAWMVMFFGLFSTRFRDIPLMLKSVIQLMFFVTPVIWSVEMLPGRPVLVTWNPFYHLVEIVRAPLLGELPALESVAVAAGLAAAGTVVSFYAFVLFRRRIAYWV